MSKRLELDADGIIERCGKSDVPVGVPLEAAIAAHMSAVERRDIELQFYLIRTVLLAHTSSVVECERLRDYLAALPLASWAGVGWDAARARRDALELMNANIRALA